MSASSRIDVVDVSFSEALRKKANSIWERIFRHPFIVEMSEGVLPLDKFKFYTQQDYVYLIEFSKGLAVATAKAREVEDLQKFVEFLHVTITLEMAALEELASKLNIPTEGLVKTRPTPTTYAYTRHLLNIAYFGSFGEFVASILPCEWSFLEIGDRIIESEKLRKHPIYSNWTATYCSEEYRDLVVWLKGLLDRLAETSSQSERRRMEEYFIIGSRYEYMFWDMAYKLERWPV